MKEEERFLEKIYKNKVEGREITFASIRSF
jgi:hypothetical protein